ncbi:MAG TPA: sialidase family protein [Acidimicrobiales bacterium]|jgi:hypothetical protein
MRVRALSAAIALVVGGLVVVAPTVSEASPAGRFGYQPGPGRPRLSGAADPSLATLTGRAVPAGAASAPRASDDVQANGDNKRDTDDQYGSGEGFPQNETAAAVNPTDPSNVLVGANDYEHVVDSVMGLYASFDEGRTFSLSRFIPQVITPDRRMLGTGDPAIAFDRAGVAYSAVISFGRADCDSYVAVSRSYDKGVTWSAPVGGESAGTGLVVGDGIVAHNGGPEDCRIFHDKEWIAAGPRPEGVELLPGTNPDHVGADRLYVVWTRFDFGEGGLGFNDAPIYLSMSDDEGRSWSPGMEINGRAPFCEFQFGDADGQCDESQFAIPVTDPRTGRVYVAFENFNTPSTVFNRYLVTHSDDGGQTWSRPVLATRVVDGADTYPTCFGSQTLDLMCARVNANGNIDLDPRNGDLYLTWADNRNGSPTDTNTDVFVTTSRDGGATWSPARNLTGTSEDDQWFPWLAVSPEGTVVVTYFDRRYNGPLRIDTSLSVSTDAGATYSTRRVSEVSWNPDFAFRLGTFIGDYNGLDVNARTAFPAWTDARFGERNEPGNNPPHQQSDVMVDAEPIPGAGGG